MNVRFLQVVILLMEEKSSSDVDDVKKSALDLEISKIKVIPIAIGTQADKKELISSTPYKDNLITPDVSDPANRTAEKIVIKAIKGKQTN